MSKSNLLTRTHWPALSDLERVIKRVSRRGNRLIPRQRAGPALPIQQAQRELKSEQDRDCREPAFSPRPNTLAVILRETLSISAANAQREVDFAMPRFTSAAPNFS
jgi:hypothetical protein